jgi:hypothetical protein
MRGLSQTGLKLLDILERAWFHTSARRRIGPPAIRSPCFRGRSPALALQQNSLPFTTLAALPKYRGADGQQMIVVIQIHCHGVIQMRIGGDGTPSHPFERERSSAV